MLQLPDFKQ
jgi:hypothetical protein